MVKVDDLTVTLIEFEGVIYEALILKSIQMRLSKPSGGSSVLCK